MWGAPLNRKLEGTAWWIAAAMMMAVLGGASGCATLTGSGMAGGGDVKTVWQQGEQFVRIERQDNPAGALALLNTQPVDVPVDRLRYMLESIDVYTPGKDKPVSLLNDDEIKELSEKIHEALAKAGPSEDVTFATIGNHAVLMGFLKQRMVTAGRVFCTGGEINFIFGDILREVTGKEDRRLYPIVTGSRAAGRSRELRLIPQQDREVFTLKRPDWVIFPIAGAAAPTEAPASARDAGSPAVEGSAATPGGVTGKKAPGVKRSVEERLNMLNELRSKKLITDEEYRVKRLEILNEL